MVLFSLFCQEKIVYAYVFAHRKHFYASILIALDAINKNMIHKLLRCRLQWNNITVVRNKSNNRHREEEEAVICCHEREKKKSIKIFVCDTLIYLFLSHRCWLRFHIFTSAHVFIRTRKFSYSSSSSTCSCYCAKIKV